MNRSQGFAATAIVVAGAMLRGGLGGSPGGVAPQLSAPETSTAGAVQRLSGKGEGPWKASCNYWKAGQNSPPPQEKPPDGTSKTLSSLTITLSHDNKRLDSHITGSVDEDRDPPCGADGWGIPAASGAQDPAPQGKASAEVDGLGITTLIATVPDPLHSSLPLEFDRAIEALTQAAAQYGYVGSYFWLPWHRSSTESGKTPNTADTQSRDDSDREKQPGLLILKQEFAVPSLREANAIAGKPGRVIYLFLVGQSPALGTNGDQIGNALRYERSLAAAPYHARRSLKTPRNEADIIGPSSSGAAASLRAALESQGDSNQIYELAGITSTHVAADLLNRSGPDHSPVLHYRSFDDDSLKERNSLVANFTTQNHNRETRLALLTEAGTVFGLSEAGQGLSGKTDPLIIPFPRDISLLRNGSTDSGQAADAAAASGISPYLHLSLKDSSAEDNIPPFARPMYMFSQEAQWMAIARELKDHRINVVAVSASNVLDELFLIKSLHRDIPDIQVVVYDGGDLLFARIGDNDAYIGDITFTAYPLTDLSSVTGSREHYNFPDSLSEAYFNAAAYTFWDGRETTEPLLADYRNPFVDDHLKHPPLWATVVGRDGYYPVSLVNSAPSDNQNILPDMGLRHPALAQANPLQEHGDWSPAVKPGSEEGLAIPAVSPGFTWYLLCMAISLLCVVHGIVLWTANFWSPATHDLAVTDSDRPRRRAVYVNIAAAVLIAMSFIAAFPVLPAWHLLHHSNMTALTAVLTLLSGLFSAFTTLAKTRGFLHRPKPRPPTVDAASMSGRKLAAQDTEGDVGFYPIFNALALGTAVLVPLAWILLCVRNNVNSANAYLGVFFSYRCLFPASGVCPLLPVLLILVTWYIWAHVQAKRLRFSDNRRPMLPGRVGFDLPHYFYVSDEDLSRCSSPVDACLYERMNCLLITRQLIRRSFAIPAPYLNHVLGCAYAALFLGFIFFARVHGLDHFFRSGRFPGLYETLICGLFFPLIVIAITGCIRIYVIWAALNAGLLEPLERSPLRFAFSRMHGVSWVSMLRQSGVYEYWRDMTRSMESMGQLLSNPELREELHTQTAGTLSMAEQAQADLSKHLAALWALIRPTPATDAQPSTGSQGDQIQTQETQNYLLGGDLPCEDKCMYLNLMCAVESDFANFAQALIASVLGPYWTFKRKGFVANDPLASEAAPESSTTFEKGIPEEIQLAEEFVAIRYIALIRAVLINLRYLTTFVSTAFVLALLAWNSYPFQPRQWVDWTFTLLLAGSCATVFGVYAQMHRSPILSRITGTTANELGGAFFLRLLTFGAIPFLTWLASQFPTVSNTISRLLQSGLSPAK